MPQLRAAAAAARPTTPPPPPGRPAALPQRGVRHRHGRRGVQVQVHVAGPQRRHGGGAAARFTAPSAGAARRPPAQARPRLAAAAPQVKSAFESMEELAEAMEEALQEEGSCAMHFDGGEQGERGGAPAARHRPCCCPRCRGADRGTRALQAAAAAPCPTSPSTPPGCRTRSGAHRRGGPPAAPAPAPPGRPGRCSCAGRGRAHSTPLRRAGCRRRGASSRGAYRQASA